MPPRKSGDFKKGDKVKAKWSGSNKYYAATVMEVEGKQCKVKFEDDGTVSTIKLGDIKDMKSSSAKSESKSSRVRSRSRSAGRPVGRPPLRSRSRTPKKESARKSSPVKRSPSRKASPAKKPRASKTDKKTPKTETAKGKKANSVTPEKASMNKKLDLVRDEEKLIKSRSPITNRSPPSETVRYSEVIQESKIVSNTSSSSSSQQRSSARIAALQTTRVSTPESSMEKRILRSSKGKAKYSDDEESEDEVDTASSAPKKFSYLSVSALSLKTVILPLIPLLLCWFCSRRHCSILNSPPLYSKLKDFWDDIMIPLSACFTFHLALSVLSKIPVGREATGFPFGSKNMVRKYRLNGLYLLLLSAVIFGGLTYYKIDMNWGHDRIKGIVVSSIIYTTLWSFVIHLRALIRGVSSDQAKSNQEYGALGNFYYGHEINPILHFDEDVKTRFIHFGLIGLFLMNLSVLTKLVMKSSAKVFVDDCITKGSPLLLNVVLQLFTILDYFVREESMLSSSLYTDDGVGYGFLLGVGSVIPSIFALQSVFLAIHGKEIHLPYYCTAGIVILFSLGYAMYLLSSNVKHNFRRNPYSPSVAHVQSIPTSKKKRLITSGLWGIIRHPNYLGFMIMVLALSLTCGFSYPLAYTPFIVIVLTLVFRSLKVDVLCQEKYGPAWNNYAQKAKKRFIPYVF